MITSRKIFNSSKSMRYYNKNWLRKTNYEYSADNDTNNFYLWFENIVLPIKLGNTDYHYHFVSEIRKIIYKSINDRPNHYYNISTTYLELYMEQNGYPIEQTYQVIKEFERRIKLANYMGKDIILEYHKKEQTPENFALYSKE